MAKRCDNGVGLALGAIATLAGASLFSRLGSRNAESYRVSTLGGDPEWGEPGYVTFWPKSAGERHYQWEEVSGEYVPVENDLLLEEALLSVLPSVTSVAADLGLGAPYVVLANLSDEGHLARFVDGTEGGNPVLLIDPANTSDMMPSTMERFVLDSLRHELGHAMLRSMGIPFEDEEEDVVERFGLTGRRSVLDDYAQSFGEVW